MVIVVVMGPVLANINGRDHNRLVQVCDSQKCLMVEVAFVWWCFIRV